jgi:hypothetical protein
MKQSILSTAYLGTVSYYAVIAQSGQVFVEQFDSYHKQTYRNRCRIVAANGLLDLVIPVVKNSGTKTIVKDVKIDYSTRWQVNHWRSLFSAYNSSPFFEFYSAFLEPFYRKKWNYLIDFNQELMGQLLEILQINVNIVLTGSYEKEYLQSIDLRDAISPKKELTINGRKPEFIPYTQTFSEKFEFVPDLSIVDLLFNCGPEAEALLLKMRF